jgi:hypothetical protein
LKRSQWIRVAISISDAKNDAPKMPAAEGWNCLERNVRRKK